jgi:hypothetical protein
MRTASTIWATGSLIASAIWAWVIPISFGMPLTRSRPRIWTVRPVPSAGVRATPKSYLIRSAVASPISRL